jgi:hypothetical protein
VTVFPVRQSIIELGPVFDEGQCAGLVEWAERRGLSPWPADAESPALSRCGVEEAVFAPLWPLLAEAIRRALRCESLRLVGPPVIDRFKAGQRLPPAAGGGIECGREAEKALGVVAFLGGACAGGEFICYPHDGPVTVAPTVGTALVFPAFLTCEDAPVRAGRKYVLRAAVAVAGG